MWFFVTGETIGTWKCYSQLQRSPECRETRQRMRNEEKDWLFCIYVCTFLRLLKMPSCYSHWHLILDNFLWCFFKKYFIETFWRFFLKCSENFLKTFLYIKRKTFNVFKIVEDFLSVSRCFEWKIRLRYITLSLLSRETLEDERPLTITDLICT